MSQSNECVFCKMLRGEESCQKLYENEAALCILDIGQIISDTGGFIPGRSLVIPKRHVTWFYDLEDEEAGQLFTAAKIVALKIKRAFNPDFVTVFIRGQRVPHAHIILQPETEGDPISRMFTSVRSSLKVAPEELLSNMAQRIREG